MDAKSEVKANDILEQAIEDFLAKEEKERR